MARSMFSLGMFAERHFSSTIRSRGFISGSPPPVFAAIVISRASFEKILPRFASMAPLKCLTLAHLLCPAISSQFKTQICGSAAFESTCRFDQHRCAVAQHFGYPGGDLGRIITHAYDGVRSQFAG